MLCVCVCISVCVRISSYSSHRLSISNKPVGTSEHGEGPTLPKTCGPQCMSPLPVLLFSHFLLVAVMLKERELVRNN